MKTILVPSDFSKNATTALRYALRLCQITKCNLVVFHCTHLSSHILATADSGQINILIKEDILFKQKKLTAQVAKANQYLGLKKKSVPVQVIVESNPLLVDHILEVAQRVQAGLIVTGTHGATGLNRFFFGSNTSGLISRATIPVLAVPAGARFRAIRNMAFSSDLEQFKSELDRLVPFAALFGSRINVLYLDYGLDSSQKLFSDAKETIKKATYKKIRLIKQPATIEFSLVRQVKDYLSKHSQQWLVMFTKERSFWNKVFYGGKTELMSYSIKIPLLSFKKQEGSPG